MERKDVLDRLLPIVRRTVRSKIQEIHEEDDFRDVLGFDSLDMTLIAIRCEKEFNVVFNGEELQIKKVGDLVDFIQGIK